MKILLLSVAAVAAGTAGLVHTGVLPCPCEVASQLFGDCCDGGACEVATDAPAGLYVEARDATVWGGACHISGEAGAHGSKAIAAWSFESGSHDGVDLTGVRVVAAVQGDVNLQANEVFQSMSAPTVTSRLWIDAPDESRRDAAIGFVTEALEVDAFADVVETGVVVTRSGDVFEVSVADAIRITGEAMADRSCCTMPESRWYTPLAPTTETVVGNPTACRFEGDESMTPWTFEGENSVFVGTFGSAVDSCGTESCGAQCAADEA